MGLTLRIIPVILLILCAVLTQTVFKHKILGKLELFFHLSLAGVINMVAHIMDARYATSHFSQANREGFAVVLMESISMTQSPCLLSLPVQYAAFINHPHISSMSCVLNLIFSFASMEMRHPFPIVPSPPGFLAIQCHIYHHVQPNHNNSSIHWLLFDGFM